MNSPGRPEAGEYAAFYEGYIATVARSDVARILSTQSEAVRDLAARVGPDRETFRYAPGKWSIRQVVGHLVDGERVFGYRAFCFSRGETKPLPGFDEDTYIARAPYETVTLRELAEEFAVLRHVNLVCFDRLTPQQWTFQGNANGTAISLRALAHIMAGHVEHHLAVLRDRYGA